MRDISGRLPSLGIPEERPLLRRLPTLAWGLPACALLLAVLGLTVVRSASTELAVDYLPRQAAWVAVGVAAMAVGFAIGHVIDVIYTPWMMPAIYNVADMFIVTMMICVALLVLLGVRLDGTREPRAVKETPAADTAATDDAAADDADASTVRRTDL